MTPQLSSVTMTTRTRRGFLVFSVFILLLDFPLPSLGLPSPFCVGQGCLGNPGSNIRIRNPGSNIPIRIKTPRIGNPGRFNRKLSSTQAAGVGGDYQINRRGSLRSPQPLASGKAQRRPSNWRPQPTQPTPGPGFRSSDLQLNRRRPRNWIPQPTQPTPEYSDYSEEDLEDLSPSQNRMLTQSETGLPAGEDYRSNFPWGGNKFLDGKEGEDYQPSFPWGDNFIDDKDYQFSTFHPGGHQLPLRSSNIAGKVNVKTPSFTRGG